MSRSPGILDQALSGVAKAISSAKQSGWDRASVDEVTKQKLRAEYAFASEQGAERQKKLRLKIAQAWIFGIRLGKHIGGTSAQTNTLAQYCAVYAGAMGEERMLREIENLLGHQFSNWPHIGNLFVEVRPEAEEFEPLLNLLQQLDAAH